MGFLTRRKCLIREHRSTLNRDHKCPLYAGPSELFCGGLDLHIRLCVFDNSSNWVTILEAPLNREAIRMRETGWLRSVFPYLAPALAILFISGVVPLGFVFYYALHSCG